MHVSVQEQHFLMKRLSTLIAAGVPLFESLQLLSAQTKGSSALLVQHLIDAVTKGRGLAAGFQECGNVLNLVSLHLIEIGEQTGMLPEHLKYVTEQLGQQQAMRRKIWSALVYPLFVFIVAVAVALLLLLYVLPKLMPIFASLHFKLPLTTRILLRLYTVITQDFIGLLLVVILIIATVWIVVRARSVRAMWQKCALYIPVFRLYVIQYQNWHICRTLAVLLKAEMPLLTALEKTSRSTQYRSYNKALLHARARVLEGYSLGSSLQLYPKLFPLQVAQLLLVGEETGTLAESLQFMAANLEEETEELTKKITVLFEPALLLMVGLVVGFVAIAIISPIYGITQAIHF